MTSSRTYGRSSRRRKNYPEEGIAMFHKASLQAVPSEHLPAAHALRRPLPGVTPSLRLEDAGDAKPAWTTLLTTEHYNLTDAARGDDQRVERPRQRLPRRGLGRAHSPRVREHARRIAYRAHDLPGPVLTPLVFLGLVAFVRCLEIAIDDWEFVTRITRLRCTYDQVVPDLAPLMSQAVADEGLVAMLSPRWQPFQKMLSVAGSVA